LGQKYTKCNKINNNSENFRGSRFLPGGIHHPALLVAGLYWWPIEYRKLVKYQWKKVWKYRYRFQKKWHR